MLVSTTVTGVQWEEVVWQSELPKRYAESWDQLVEVVRDVALFRRREWVEMLQRHGLATPWRLVVIWKGTRSIALFPLSHEYLWTATYLDGQCWTDGCYLVEPGEEVSAWNGLLDWFTASRISLLSLGACVDTRLKTLLEQHCAAQGLRLCAQEVKSTVRAGLPASWPEYEAKLDKRALTALRKVERRLIQDYPDAQVVLTSGQSADREEVLHEFMALHRRRWKAYWAQSGFEEARARAFFLEMMQRAFAADCAVIASVRIEGKLVASAIAHHAAGESNCHYYHVARDTEALPSRYAVGYLVLKHLLCWGMQRGASVMDMAVGTYDYKLAMGGELTPMWELQIARSPLAARYLPALHWTLANLRHPLRLQLRRLRYHLTQRFSARQSE